MNFRIEFHQDSWAHIELDPITSQPWRIILGDRHVSDVIIAIIVRQPTHRGSSFLLPKQFFLERWNSNSNSLFFIAFADHVRRSRASSELGILIATTRSFDILALLFSPFFSKFRESVIPSKRSFACFWTKSGELVRVEACYEFECEERFYSGFVRDSWREPSLGTLQLLGNSNNIYKYAKCPNT